MYVDAKCPVPRWREARPLPPQGAKPSGNQDVHEAMAQQRHAPSSLGTSDQDLRGRRGARAGGRDALHPRRPTAQPRGARERRPDSGTKPQARCDGAGQRRLPKMVVDQRDHGRRDESRRLDRPSQGARDEAARVSNQLLEISARGGALHRLERGVALSLQPLSEAMAWNWSSEVPGGQPVSRENDPRQARLDAL